MKIVILAGGGGTRLWPVSRVKKPKQFQPFLGDETLLQKTYQRLAKIFKAGDIFVSTNFKYLTEVRKQLPKVPKNNFILEPEKKDTAAAIGLAASYLHKRDPKSFMSNINADHYIKDEIGYLKTLQKAKRVIHNNPDHLLLLGCEPTFPDVHSGYIRKATNVFGQKQVYRVGDFVEKPDLAKAAKYFKSGQYLINTGSFVWRVDHALDLFKKYLPKTGEILRRIEAGIGTKNEQKILKTEFAKIEPISIDYGVIEKVRDKIIVLKTDYIFNDVGSWETLWELLAHKGGDNITRGFNLLHDSTGNLIYNFTDKLIAVVGLRDMVVVQTKDALLVCPKKYSKEAKKIVSELEKKKMKKFL